MEFLLSTDPSISRTGFTLWEKQENWKPIYINSCSFKKDTKDFDLINYKVFELLEQKRCRIDKLNIVIERGIFNPKFGRGKETLDHLRGFIASQFNKLLNKDMLVIPTEWRKWYKKIFAYARDKKWDKDLSIYLANNLINSQNWNIEIKDHDQAESLLIGWYWINKDVK